MGALVCKVSKNWRGAQIDVTNHQINRWNQREINSEAKLNYQFYLA